MSSRRLAGATTTSLGPVAQTFLLISGTRASEGCLFVWHFDARGWSADCFRPAHGVRTADPAACCDIRVAKGGGSDRTGGTLRPWSQERPILSECSVGRRPGGSREAHAWTRRCSPSD